MRTLIFLIITACLMLPTMAGPLPKPDATFPPHAPAKVALGQLLFYDPILSGNKNVSCATCHHPKFGTSDGLSLGLGDGGIGLGPERQIDPQNPPEERVPRNAPALFNLGASQFMRMFHDGRLEEDPNRPSGLRTPLEDDMVMGFESALSAQAMFPVLSPDEMAGHYQENDVAKAVRQGLLAQPGGAWDIISARIAQIPTYRTAFDAVIGETKPIHFVDIANAIAAFIAVEWRADDSPFDRYLKQGTPLPSAAQAGMQLFYGKANCDSCHTGQFQTDHQFHAIAMPQIGPGKKTRFETHFKDIGRMLVNGNTEDAYRFRTPSLRNVTQTAPYGHNGAYASLRAVIKHHLDPVNAFNAYDPAQANLPKLAGSEDFKALNDPQERARILAANSLEPIALSDLEIDQLIAFLHALTDQQAKNGRHGVPKTVPSGLPVDQ